MKPHIRIDAFTGVWICSRCTYRIGYGRDEVEAYDVWKRQPV